MALNSDFKVKDSLYVGNSACFVGQTDTPKILSAGTELFDIFLQEGEIAASCTLSNGTGIATVSFDGSADATVSVDATCNTTWNSAYTTTQSNSANWVDAAAWCSTNGDNVIDTVATGNAQGRVAVTDIGNTTTQVVVNGLQTGDTPTFGGLCTTGDLTVDGTVDGRDVAADGTTLDTLQSLSGDNGLTFSSPSQGTLRVTESDGDTTDVDLGVQNGDSVQFTGVCATGNITTSGTVDGRDVAADGTTTDTLQSLSGNNLVSANATLTQGLVNLDKADGSNINADTGLQTSDSVQFVGVCATGNITTSGTVDGRSVQEDGITLDALQALSGDNLASGSSPSQGTVRLTSTDGTNSDIDTGLQAADSPSFAGLDLTSVSAGTDNSVLVLNGTSVVTDEIDSRVWGTSLVDGSGTANQIPLWTDGNTVGNSAITQDANGLQITGGLSATGTLSGDGSALTGVTATPTFPTNGTTDLTNTSKLFVNDGASCEVACNKHITYQNMLDDMAGVGIQTEPGGATDELGIKNNANFTGNQTLKWDSGNGQFVDSIASDDGTTYTVAGSATIQGDLTVQGNFTCLDTIVTTTSAFSISNHGTGPALSVEQTGANCDLATFVDSEGGNVTIYDGGKVGIGTAGAPSEKLTVSGNLSANGTAQIDGAATIGGTATFDNGVNFCGVCTGTDNTVLVQNSDGSLATDEIDSKVWDGKLVDSSAATMTLNNVPKVTNTAGTIGSSNISDTGTEITLNSATTIGDGDIFKMPSAGGTVNTQTKVFTATVDSTETGVTTFAKTGLDSVSYDVTLQKGVNKTAFKVHAVYNGTAPCGTVYAIVDAQAASQLGEVAITSDGITIDLDITAASDGTTATIRGVAHY